MARQNSRTYRYSSTAYVNTNAYSGSQAYAQQSLNYPVASKRSNAIPNHRDRMREIKNLRYDNTFLNQDRVEQIFGVELDSDYCRDGNEIVDDIDVEDFFYKSSPEIEEGYQYSLNLENVDEVEAKLVRAIRKYREATAKMAGMALLWHDLMEDLEDNPHLQEAYDRFHMLRKLSGGTC